MFLGVRKRQKVLEILYGGWGKQPTLIARIQKAINEVWTCLYYLKYLMGPWSL